MQTRERLHRLVDELPESELHAAERYLDFLRTAGDPLLRALAAAPVDDEPLTPDDEAAIAEARAEYERGASIPWEELRKELLRGSDV